MATGDVGPRPWPVVGEDKLVTLDPAFRPFARRWLRLMQERGWKMRVVWCRRTKEQNDKLVARGTASPRSKHLVGLAMDCINRADPYPRATEPEIAEMRTGVTLGEELSGLRYYCDARDCAALAGVFWGGSKRPGWTRWDPTHIQALESVGGEEE